MSPSRDPPLPRILDQGRLLGRRRVSPIGGDRLGGHGTCPLAWAGMGTRLARGLRVTYCWTPPFFLAGPTRKWVKTRGTKPLQNRVKSLKSKGKTPTLPTHYMSGTRVCLQRTPFSARPKRLSRSSSHPKHAMSCGIAVRSDSALLNGETRSLSPATVHCFREWLVAGSRALFSVSLFLAGGWWILPRLREDKELNLSGARTTSLHPKKHHKRTRTSSSFTAARSAAANQVNLQKLKISTSSRKISWISTTQRQVSPSGLDWAWRNQKMCSVCPFSRKELPCWQSWNHKQKWRKENTSFYPWHGEQENTQSQGQWLSKKQRCPDSMAEQSKGKAPIHSKSGKASTTFTTGSDFSWAPSCASSNPLSGTFSVQPKAGLQANLLSGNKCPGMTMCATNLTSFSQAESSAGPFFLRLRERINWWKKNTNNPHVLELIQNGVAADFPLPTKLSTFPCVRNQKETQMAWETIKEYLEVKALKEIQPSEAKHLIP